MTWVVLPNIKRVKIMNEQNQSILSFSHIVFDELSFKRIGFRQPDEQEIQTTIGCTVRAFAPNQYGVTLTVQADKSNEYNASAQITGYCEINDDFPQRDLILRENAAAILYPYARSALSLLTAQPETTPIVLPVVNIHDLAKNASGDNVDGNSNERDIKTTKLYTLFCGLYILHLNLLTHGSRLHFSNIPLGHRSESNQRSPAGHCR